MITALALALGVTRIVQLVKDAVPVALEAWVKASLAILLSAVGSIFLTSTLEEWFIMTAAASGLTSVIHEVTSALSLYGDDKKQQVILRAGGVRQRR